MNKIKSANNSFFLPDLLCCLNSLTLPELILLNLIGNICSVWEKATNRCRRLRRFAAAYVRWDAGSTSFNGVSRAQHSRLSSSALAPYLSDIFVSEDAGFQKPRKEYFDYVFARIPDFDSKKALMVGDSLSSDMRGALAAGLDRCWFNPSHQPLPDAPSLTYVIYSLTQLLEIVTF